LFFEPPINDILKLQRSALRYLRPMRKLYHVPDGTGSESKIVFICRLFRNSCYDSYNCGTNHSRKKGSGNMTLEHGKRGLLSVIAVLLGGVLIVSCGAVNITASGEASGVAQGGGDAKGGAESKGKGEGNGQGGGLNLNNLKDAAHDATSCPNLTSAEAVAKLDFKKEFGLDAKASAKVKSALEASYELKAVSVEIDGELKAACSKLAEDLGKPVPKGHDVKAACKAAADAIADLKSKAGGSFSLEVVPPKCAASMDAMTDCAAKCDAEVKPGTVEVECEGGELSGSCEGKCKGKCDVEAGAVCSGTCNGSCEAKFSGTCAGKCDGKCDGKTTAGAAECDGKCEGSCDAGAKGSCKSQCKGECEIKGQASCQGTCTGACDVKMKAPKCTGEAKPPKVTAECKAHCDAKVSARMECTPAHATVKTKGAADAAASKKLAAVLKADLPAILKIAIGMKDKLIKVSGSVKTAVADVQGSLKGLVRDSPAMAAKLTACAEAPFKAAFDAAADIQTSMSASVSVEASASAKAGASGKTK
jgi:hypothetical protein